MAAVDLPALPAPHAELVKYIAENPEKPIVDIIEPYRQYEAKLRSIFAQDRQNPVLNDPYINVVPLFTNDTKLVTTRARDLASESEEEKSKYIMALPAEQRRAHGSPATVASFSDFQKNFNIFSESSLTELNWDNVVAAGSSVVNTLLPVPKAFNTNKRKLREYYHEKFCPASDVDLFLYGLTHEQAVEKIKQIEQAVRDSVLSEVTVVRTKYAITIASQYPVRHIQVVLRVYKSVSEILTGFDIDAAGGAYDGKQVYVTPRALNSFITQINHVDLSRRSPSYENRLSKYSHRNFEVYWPELDRSRIDPTIFERSFKRTLGLARLLVLETLPTTSAREAYMNKRREERGRPQFFKSTFEIGGNIKDNHEDEIADWLSEEDISNYHTFTVPYGQKFNAKRIEKLCYTRDLLLNAEWNVAKEREVYLHRHPAFFGRVEDVIEDCCGTCPKPVTPEEIEIAEKEAEIYISGKVSFLIDDPGRQQIGSFNPLTEQDWTDMAYVGNTARLCQSIVACDADDVSNWLSQDGADPNQRDYTGRTPLHLAVMVSTPEIVRLLINHGSRITARLADGKTALHLAASRGELDIIKALMEKSIENEAAEEERQAKKRAAKSGNPSAVESGDSLTEEKAEADDDADDSDAEMIDRDDAESAVHSIATGSFVKVKKDQEEKGEDMILDESDDEPDYFETDVLAWDVPSSPLHLAIAEGNEDAVKLLCDYGADSILPVKFVKKDRPETAAILTLALALSLPVEKAISMARLLLKLGATSSQADSNGCTAFHRFVEHGDLELVHALLENNQTGVKSAINHFVFSGYNWDPMSMAISPMETAIQTGDAMLVLKLLNAGGTAEIDFESWLKSAKVAPSQPSSQPGLEENKWKFRTGLEQPLITAVRGCHVQTALELLDHGANPNALTLDTENALQSEHRRSWTQGCSALDVVQDSIKQLTDYQWRSPTAEEPTLAPGIDTYLQNFEPGTYQYSMVESDIKQTRSVYDSRVWNYKKQQEQNSTSRGLVEMKAFFKETISDLKTLEGVIIAKGGKTCAELYPDIRFKDRTTFGSYNPGMQAKPVDYGFKIWFRGDMGITESRTDLHLKLMEAAWSGDVETLKSLTLQALGPEQDQPPLKMTVRDHLGSSPFSIAVLRGHLDAAKAILEIIKAQWSPLEVNQVRYRMKQHDDEDDGECSDEASSADSDPQLVSENIAKGFTIDNIGEVSLQVTSHEKPITHILCRGPTFNVFEKERLIFDTSHRSLFDYFVDKEDTASLKVLLEMALHYGSQKFEGDNEESDGSFVFPQDSFLHALQEGKVEQLQLIIKRTGAGIPLDHLVKGSGVELKQKPRYYQGLTVYGKKRNDWATAGRNMVVKATGVKTPPLLHAAISGHPEGVQFFLTDIPHRLYGEFAKSKAGNEDVRLKHLKNSPGGFDRAVSKWLGADNEYVIHCALFAKLDSPSLEVLEYLLKHCPELIEKKTSQGDTPLLVACRLGRPQHIKMLLKAGADQSAKNLKGENIIHVLLAGSPTAKRLRRALDLLDPDLRSHLFLQRKSLQQNGTTPLHAWISQICGVRPEDETGQQYRNRYHYYNSYSQSTYKKTSDMVATLKLLLEYSKGEELDMLNGAGDTCLHTAILYNKIWLVKTLIDFRPQLLQRENAVGRTPAEFAHDRATAVQFQEPGTVTRDTQLAINNLMARDPKTFIHDPVLDGLAPEQLKVKIAEIGLSRHYKIDEIRSILKAIGNSNDDDQQQQQIGDSELKMYIWDLCETAVNKHTNKRRLVSLNEANDVAKRIGEKHASSRYLTINVVREEDGEAGNGQPNDRSDFVVTEFEKAVGSAWEVSDGEAEEYGLERCKSCNAYHDA